MFLKVKYMSFLLMKIPDLVLNFAIILSGFWAGFLILPLAEIGPLIGVLVPIGIHLLKYFDERKMKRQQSQMEGRLKEVETEKARLKEQFDKFETEREAFRKEQRSGLQSVIDSIEKLTTRKLKTPKEQANDEQN